VAAPGQGGALYPLSLLHLCLIHSGQTDWATFRLYSGFTALLDIWLHKPAASLSLAPRPANSPGNLPDQPQP
jgi:hypothetical protein